MRRQPLRVWRKIGDSTDAASEPGWYYSIREEPERGPFVTAEAAYHAASAELASRTDPLAPARGMVVGAIAGAVLWGWILLLVSRCAL